MTSETFGADASSRQARHASMTELLTLIRQRGASTKRELAESLRLARSTVSQRLDALADESIVTSTTSENTSRGRPAARYSFNPDAGVILVGHFGVSATHVGITNLEGRILADRRADYSASQPADEVLDELTATFDALLEETGRDRSVVWGIAVGLPSPFELTANGPSSWPTHWDEQLVHTRLTAAYGAPVYIENDVNIIALGEFRAAWSSSRVFLCVKVGTGVGCSIIINDQLVTGGHGAAGEIGHTQVPGRTTTRCQCGNVGCLAAVAGGAAIAKRLRDNGIDADDARQVARLVRDGVPEAAQEVRQAGRDVGTVLSGVVNLLNPEVIVIWGYLADADDHLFAGIKETIYQHAFPISTRKLELVAARLGDSAGIVGGAQMVIDSVLSPEMLMTRFNRTASRET